MWRTRSFHALLKCLLFDHPVCKTGMDKVFLRVIIRRGAATLWDDIAPFCPSQTLADCLPSTLGIAPSHVQRVLLHSGPAPTAGAGTTTALTTPVAVCQQFGMTSVMMSLTEEVPRARPSTLMEAVLSGRVDDVRELCDLMPSRTHAQTEALAMAAGDGHVEVVKLLLNRNIDVNAADEDGWTPLLSACHNGRTEVAVVLIDAGADLSACDREYSRSSLLWAVHNQHPEVAAELLRCNADVNATDDDGRSAVMLALHRNDEALVALLLEHRAAVDLQDGSGLSPLMVAAQRGARHIVALLLAHKAQVQLQAAAARPAVLLAAEAGHRDVVQLLMDHGAEGGVQGTAVSELLAAAEEESKLHRTCGDCGHAH